MPLLAAEAAAAVFLTIDMFLLEGENCAPKKKVFLDVRKLFVAERIFFLHGIMFKLLLLGVDRARHVEDVATLGHADQMVDLCGAVQMPILGRNPALERVHHGQAHADIDVDDREAVNGKISEGPHDFHEIRVLELQIKIIIGIFFLSYRVQEPCVQRELRPLKVGQGEHVVTDPGRVLGPARGRHAGECHRENTWVAQRMLRVP